MKPVDVIVIILTLCVLIVVLSPAVRVVMTGMPLPEKAADILGNVIASVVAVIAIYVGKVLGNNDDK